MAKKEKAPKEPKKKKEKKEKPEKPPKMQSSAPRRFGAYCFVFFMIFMVAFGVYKIINSPTEHGIQRIIKRQMAALDQDVLARTKAVNFAEEYAIAYFSYIQNEDYTEKMSKYYADGVIAVPPAAISRIAYVGTSAVDVDGNKVNVDVMCQVAYASDNETYDVAQFVTIRVPIKIDKKGNCAVVSTPVYVATDNDSKTSKSVMMSIDGDTTLADIDTINDTIQNFFAVYYKGTSSELKYYVTKNYGNPNTIGLDIDVTNVNTQIKQDGDKWIAECNISIDNNGIPQEQHCFLEIVKGAEGRYYINKLYTM